jgi:phosphate transport system substrate-binding protein
MPMVRSVARNTGMGLLCLLLALDARPADQQSVQVVSSSAGFPLAKAAVAGYSASGRSQTRVHVESDGTAGAFRRLCRDQADVVVATRSMNFSEKSLCDSAQLELFDTPIARDGVVLVVNVRNNFLKNVTLDELRTVWSQASQRKITRWRQVNSAWPDAPIKLLAPDAASGDAAFFNDSVLGNSMASRTDYMASMLDSVIVKGVARDTNALGYLPLAYYEENRQVVRAVSVAANAGTAGIFPSKESVAQGRYQPLTRSIVLYVNRRSLTRPDVAAFARYFVANGGRLAREAHYVPLAEENYRGGLARIQAAR